MAKAVASVYRPGRAARRGRRSSRTAATPHPVPKAKRPGDAPLRVHPPNHSAPPRIGPSGPRSLTWRPVPTRERLPPTSRGPAKTFLNAFVLLPCQIITTGRQLIYRLLAWNPHLPIFFRLLKHLRC